MKRCIPAILALCLAACVPYSKVKEKRPLYQRPITAVGDMIAQVISSERRDPQAAIGKYLDAASTAAGILKKEPGNAQALRDYNFAVSSVFNVLHDSKMEAWVAPLRVPGAQGEWTLDDKPYTTPEKNPTLYHILPADRYSFSGSAINQRTIKPGLGAPLVINGDTQDFTKLDRFAQGKQLYAGATAVIRFEGRRAEVSFEDPLSTETVMFNGHRFELGADFTAPIALALSRNDPSKLEIMRMFRPQKFAETARLARFQPYDPNKIPILVVHGLMSSQATWAPLINVLRGDPEIRKHYQFWFYSYPTGYPYPHSAAIMRKQLDEIEAAYPKHKKMVIIGHSMGGIISRSMLVDSQMSLWECFFKDKPDALKVSPKTRAFLSDMLMFKPRPNIARAIFVAAPHRGSDLASTWIGRLGARLIRAPETFMAIAKETMTFVTFDDTTRHVNHIPNSVDTLSPTNRFVIAINKLPMVPGVPYHSIIGDRGKGGNKDRTKPVSNDGVVPYWSSHLDGAKSEKIVPSHHNAHAHPEGIKEIHRILLEHARSR